MTDCRVCEVCALIEQVVLATSALGAILLGLWALGFIK